MFEPQNSDDRLLKETEVSEMTGIAVNTLQKYRCDTGNGRPNPGPAFVKVGRFVRYRLSQVRSWMASLPSAQ